MLISYTSIDEHPEISTYVSNLFLRNLFELTSNIVWKKFPLQTEHH